MLADRPTASVWSPVPGVRSAIRPPPCVPSLRFHRCTAVPETRPLPAGLRSHPPVMSTDCPAASDEEGGTAIPRPAIQRPISHCASPVALPCSPLPRLFRAHHRPLCRYVDRPQVAMGSLHRLGTASGASRRSPPPSSRLCLRSNSDHADKRYVLWRNRESRSRRY